VRIKLFIICTIAVLPALCLGQGHDVKVQKILHQMFDSIRNVKNLRVKIYALERFDTKFLTANSELKLEVQPRKLYFINRQKKLEILYNHETHANKALVKVHTFPYVALSLDPTGSMMRKNQHYTINEMGFEFIGYALALTISKDKEGLNHFSLKGKLQKNGYSCYLLEYETKSYTYSDYVVGEKETISSIATKLKVNDYLLHYKNGLLNEFGYLKKGSVLKVPTHYCKKAVIYVDDKLFLPVSISLYDDIGLFESYEFTSIEVNKGIREQEFSKDFKDYGF
jgi:hypothetical protein